MRSKRSVSDRPAVAEPAASIADTAADNTADQRQQSDVRADSRPEASVLAVGGAVRRFRVVSPAVH